MSKCPTCSSNYRKRISRNLLLKIVPKAKFYKCYHCKTKFLSVPYLFNEFIVKKGKRIEIPLIN